MDVPAAEPGNDRGAGSAGWNRMALRLRGAVMREGRVQRAVLACSASAIGLLAMGGCVTVVESPKQRGVLLKPDGSRVALERGGGQGGRASGHGTAPGALTAPVAPMQLPDGALAQPASGGTFASRVQVTVVPVGMLAYDGQTLPIVSPDGRFIAVQQGEAPTWPTLLATDEQVPALRTRVAWYQIAPEGLQLMQPVQALPDGLILGRDATTEGFLVESVRPDGARWIGQVAWVSGEVSWLVQGPDVNAHAAWIAPEDAAQRRLVFTRREKNAQAAVLMLEGAGGRDPVARLTGAWMFPVPAPSADRVIALDVIDGVDIVSVGLRRDGSQYSWGGAVARLPIAPASDPGTAYQVVASLQPSAWHGGLASERTDATSVGVIDPQRARAALFDGQAGALRALGRGTVASVRWDAPDGAAPEGPRARGYFLTSRQGLLFLPDSALAGQGAAEPARVLASPFVPRVVRDERGPSLLAFGPSRRSERELEVLRVVVGAGVPAQ